jgi:hypothetical protein
MEESVLKLLTTVIVGMAVSSIAAAKDVYVDSYTKKDGTYVPSHYRTAPNNTKSDNYSTYGNYNPYTGKAGTKPADDYSNSKAYDSDENND